MPVIGRRQALLLKESVDYTLPDIDTDAWKWQRLTAAPKDIPAHDHRRMLDIALYLYRYNPLAHRAIELIRDYVIGSGIRIEAEDPQVQEVIERFWYNPSNPMDQFLAQMAFEISLYGEFIVPATIQHNGNVDLGYISPHNVKAVKLRKDNPLYFESIRVSSAEDTGPESIELKVIRVVKDINARLTQDNPDSPSLLGYRAGDCFFFAINRVGDSSRGLSDLLCAADFADCLDQMIFSSLERMTHETSWIWDITLTGATQAQVDATVRDLETNPPRPGGFNVHNDQVLWKPMPVGLEARHIADEAQLIRNYALGGLGMPVHFFTEPETAGRAIAESMASPSYQSLSSRQREIEDFLREIIEFVIDQKLIRGMLDSDINRHFDIIMPKISLRDLQRTGGAMARITQALEIAAKQGWLDEELGRKVFLALLDQLGLGVNLKKSLAGPVERAESAVLAARRALAQAKGSKDQEPKTRT